jgi:phage terminase small subunit
MTPKQYKFCESFVKTGTSYSAALEAGYSKQYAKSKSSKLLDNPEVVAEIQRLRQRLNEKAEKSAVDVVNEYSRVAFTDRTSFLKADEHFPGCWVYKSPDELTDDQKALVEKVTASWHTRTRMVDGEQIKVERMEYNYVLLDKANALQQMGRHFGIFDDKLRLESGQQNPFKNATPEQLTQIRKAIISTMSGGEVVDGEYTEAGAQKVLPNGSGRTGTGG